MVEERTHGRRANSRFQRAHNCSEIPALTARAMALNLSRSPVTNPTAEERRSGVNATAAVSDTANSAAAIEER
eukprot:gene736-biopygen782